MEDYDLSSTSNAPSEILERREVIGADSSMSSSSLRPDTPIGASATLHRRPIPDPANRSASEATSRSEGEVRPGMPLGARAAYEDVKASRKSRVNFDSPSSGYANESLSALSQGQLADMERRQKEHIFNADDPNLSDGEIPGQPQHFFEDEPNLGVQAAQAPGAAGPLGQVQRHRAHGAVNTSQASFGARASLEKPKHGLYLNLSEHNPDNEGEPHVLNHFKA